MGSLVRPKEPWHIRYWAGDNIPAAVLAFEQGDDVSAEEVWAVPSARPSMAGVTTEEQLAETYWRVGRKGGLLEVMAAELTALRAVVEQMSGGSADTAAILRGVDERLAVFRAGIEGDTRDAVADAAEG